MIPSTPEPQEGRRLGTRLTPNRHDGPTPTQPPPQASKQVPVAHVEITEATMTPARAHGERPPPQETQPREEGGVPGCASIEPAERSPSSGGAPGCKATTPAQAHDRRPPPQETQSPTAPPMSDGNREVGPPPPVACAFFKALLAPDHASTGVLRKESQEGAVNQNGEK